MLLVLAEPGSLRGLQGYRQVQLVRLDVPLHG